MSIFAIVALTSAALFAGAAGYISMVEHPARLLLDDTPLLEQWQPSYAKALPIQSSLAILGGVCGLAAWYFSGQWLWIAGSVALLANWPFTIIAIMPTNKRLQAIRPAQADPATRILLLSWGRLHDFRSLLGLGSTLLFAIAMMATG